jgi:hypothetical protein
MHADGKAKYKQCYLEKSICERHVFILLSCMGRYLGQEAFREKWPILKLLGYTADDLVKVRPGSPEPSGTHSCIVSQRCQAELDRLAQQAIKATVFYMHICSRALASSILKSDSQRQTASRVGVIAVTVMSAKCAHSLVHNLSGAFMTRDKFDGITSQCRQPEPLACYERQNSQAQSEDDACLCCPVASWIAAMVLSDNESVACWGTAHFH